MDTGKGEKIFCFIFCFPFLNWCLLVVEDNGFHCGMLMHAYDIVDQISSQLPPLVLSTLPLQSPSSTLIVSFQKNILSLSYAPERLNAFQITRIWMAKQDCMSGLQFPTILPLLYQPNSEGECLDQD